MLQNISESPIYLAVKEGARLSGRGRNKASRPGTFPSFLSPERVDTLMQAGGLVGGVGGLQGLIVSVGGVKVHPWNEFAEYLASKEYIFLSGISQAKSFCDSL